MTGALPLAGARVRWMLIAMACSALLAGATAWVVTGWALHRHADHHHTHGGAAVAAPEADLHAWMHAHLDLTPEQHAAMQPGEAAFETERGRLRAEIAAANQELAAAIAQGAQPGPPMDAALQKLSAAQAALQRATLDHFFTMKRYLRPAQQRKLLEWTHDSLARH